MLLGALTPALFWPLLESEFVNLDDPEYVLQNRPVITGLTWSGIRWAFTTGHEANWHPVTWISHMLDVSLFGLNPAGHHAMNILLHTITALLVFLVLRRVTGSVGRSFFVAVLFAIHPAHVESVAWISERKDVLSAFFWFAVIGAYAAWIRKRGAARYALVLCLFAAGLMAKPMLVTLPAVLLLLDYWPLGRFGGNDPSVSLGRVVRERILEKIPLFLMSIASSVVTFFVQHAWGAVGSLETFPLGVRLANALLGYLHYLRVLVWPADLAVFYPHPGRNFSPVGVALGALLLAAVTAAAVRLRRRAPYLLVGWGWFVVTLLPVVGLVQVGKQAAADRYTYIPFVGLFVAVAWGGASIAARWIWGRPVVRGAAVVATLALAMAATVQARHWKNSETLLLHAIRVTKNNSLARNNLGNYYNTSNRPADALPHLQEALRLRPQDPAVLVNIGHSLFLQDRFDEAAAHFLEALRLSPSDGLALNNLARVRFLQGEVRESIRLYRAALAAQPNWSEVRQRLAMALLMEGETGSALRELEQAVAINPADREAQRFLASLKAFSRNPADPESNLVREAIGVAHREAGFALTNRSRYGEAAAELEKAHRMLPADRKTRVNRGVLFVRLGRLDEAAAEFREAVRLDPTSALARTNLGYVYFLQGRRQDAIDQHLEALRLQPEFPLAQNNLQLAMQHPAQPEKERGGAPRRPRAETRPN